MKYAAGGETHGKQCKAPIINKQHNEISRHDHARVKNSVVNFLIPSTQTSTSEIALVIMAPALPSPALLFLMHQLR